MMWRHLEHWLMVWLLRLVLGWPRERAQVWLHFVRRGQ
jgi:hypothetical protein